MSVSELLIPIWMAGIVVGVVLVLAVMAWVSATVADWAEERTGSASFSIIVWIAVFVMEAGVLGSIAMFLSR